MYLAHNIIKKDRKAFPFAYLESFYFFITIFFRRPCSFPFSFSSLPFYFLPFTNFSPHRELAQGAEWRNMAVWQWSSEAACQLSSEADGYRVIVTASL
jgi:hypothetical protein